MKRIKPTVITLLLIILISTLSSCTAPEDKVLNSLGLSNNKLTCVFFAGGGNGYSNTLPYIKRLLKLDKQLKKMFIQSLLLV